LITDLDGNVAQHVEYVPFGEVFIEERNNKWNTPYLFNAKELDEETGLYYYGARYYEPRVSIWYGVDPMWEKYPEVSAYAYCGNNPVNNVDLRGDSVTVLNLGTGTDQHMAMLIQNDAGKWQYFSVNGDNVYSSGSSEGSSSSGSSYGHTGGREFDDLAVGEWDSPQQFMDSYYNTKGDKDDKNSNKYGFPEGYVIPTTPEQDNRIRTKFTEISQNEEYRLNPFNPNQCATTVQRSLNKAGVETRVTNVSYRWGERFEGKVNPYLPSVAYKAIINNNPNGFKVYRTK